MTTATRTTYTLEAAIGRAERHGWTIFFDGADYAHLQRRDCLGVLHLITIDSDGTVGIYGSI